MTKSKISILTPTYNEEKNILELHKAVRSEMESLNAKYEYEHIIIDNNSRDKTIELAKTIANEDKNFKIICNARNFGSPRSQAHGLFQAEGDAVILMAADFQDPPELIKKYVEKWEKGSEIVLAKKISSDENFLMWKFRNIKFE